MSLYDSQKGLNMTRMVGSKGDLTGGGSQYYARSEVVQGGGNGYDPYMDGYTYTVTKSAGGGMSSMASGMAAGGMSSTGGGMSSMAGGMGSMGGGMR